MPVSKNWLKYSAKYHRLFDLATTHRSSLPITIKCESQKQAYHERTMCNGFIEAVRVCEPTIAQEKNLYVLMFKVENDSLIIVDRDEYETPLFSALEAVMGEVTQQPPTAPDTPNHPRGAKMEAWMEEWLGKGKTSPPTTTQKPEGEEK